MQLRHGIKQEEHQVACGQLRCRALRLVPVALRIPGPICFLGLFAHPRSPHGYVTEDSQSEQSYHSLLFHQRQQPVRELVKCCFMDSLLGMVECPASAEREQYDTQALGLDGPAESYAQVLARPWLC